MLTGADATAERLGAMTQRLLSIRFSTRYAVITRIEPGDPVNTDQWMPNCLVKPGNGWGQATMPLDQWRGRANNPSKRRRLAERCNDDSRRRKRNDYTQRLP